MRLQGVGVSTGVGYGPAYVISDAIPEPPAGERHDGDAEAEQDRAAQAVERVAEDLELRGSKAGGQARDVLGALAMMARDPGLAVEIKDLVATGLSAPRAIFEAFQKYRDLLAAAGGYLGERAADLDDIRDRAVAVLTGRRMPGVPAEPADGARPYVLVARDLAPADTALLTPAIVAAFVTEDGGPTSHTAILARAMGVPAVVACHDALSLTGDLLVDGGSGLVVQEPASDEVSSVRQADASRRALLEAATGPGRTADGHPVPLLANVGGPADLELALRNGAEGVGLYRTEFLFLDRAEAPTAAEQAEAYRAVLEAFPDGKVVVRTLDAGADKPLAFLPPPGEEPNPALGVRGLRMFRIFPDIMSGQLGALAEAAAGLTAQVQVMAPMVATAHEAAWFAAACRTAGLREAGVMIEVPAAALRSDDLAAEVDFLSIGTNDLAQYTFAADRQLGTLSKLQNAWQPALLDMIAAAVGSHGKPCGVCGEAAADPAMACVLVGLGVTSLSMAAPALPAVRAALAGHTREQCRAAARAARAATTADQAREAARGMLPGLGDLGL
ncbi:phosphoenolpyruvate--protein phosphotransferase [Nonomuraea soli]|uniref:Phosphoenolpyruvate-protein phosphotransferase n=1 Tax=Nonomuraea soli TaxID=1032476 RepID=A0A7W0CK83_9ACTN|nr:phosphoenolpyruvate--protein phosphotransferase [Nonomuraea soli]MBA2892708.1 phosphotransferase system enzyme I (PtsI) [Nonomuraea soli]